VATSKRDRNRTQPDHNRILRMSHAIHATLGDYPARAGIQPSNINGLHTTVNLDLETAAQSAG
jgi:hypothetical protein